MLCKNMVKNERCGDSCSVDLKVFEPRLYRFAPVLFFPLRLFLPLDPPDPDPEPPAPPPLIKETNSSTSNVPLAPMLDRAPLADVSATDDGGAIMTLPDSSTFRYRPRPPS